MTLGLGAAIGAVVTIPPLVFAGLPPFKKNQGFFDIDVDLGPLENFPEGKWFITKFNLVPDARRRLRPHGVRALQRPARRTSRASRSSPTAASTSAAPSRRTAPRTRSRVSSARATGRCRCSACFPAGFGCPCHGGQYDTEGNRVAGPPVRALDRYAYKVKDGRLRLVGAFSVNEVDGTGKDAIMGEYRLAQPGVHIDGIEQILYPFIPPS